MLHNQKQHLGGEFGEVVSGIVTQENYKFITNLQQKLDGTLKRCSSHELPRPLDHIVIKKVKFSTYLENTDPNTDQKQVWKEFVKDCEIECSMHAIMASNPLSRKYVPRFYFAGLDKTTFIIVMQHVPGKSLDEIFSTKKNGKYVRLTREEFKSIQKAVREMHKAGFEHGDMHTGNVILDKKSGQVFFIDFATSHLKGQSYNGSMFVKNNGHMLNVLESYVRN